MARRPPALEAERQQQRRDAADEHADQRQHREHPDDEAEADRRRQAERPARHADDEPVDDRLADARRAGSGGRASPPPARRCGCGRAARRANWSAKPVEVAPAVGEQEQHEDAGHDVRRRRRRRASDTASLRTRSSRSSTNACTRVGEVDARPASRSCSSQRLGGASGAFSLSSSSESSRSLARPTTSAAIDREHAEQHDDDGQPARQDPVDEVDERIDQQGDDAAGDDPADRAVGELEGVGERRTPSRRRRRASNADARRQPGPHRRAAAARPGRRHSGSATAEHA